MVELAEALISRARRHLADRRQASEEAQPPEQETDGPPLPLQEGYIQVDRSRLLRVSVSMTF